MYFCLHRIRYVLSKFTELSPFIKNIVT